MHLAQSSRYNQPTWVARAKCQSAWLPSATTFVFAACLPFQTGSPPSHVDLIELLGKLVECVPSAGVGNSKLLLQVVRLTEAMRGRVASTLDSQVGQVALVEDAAFGVTTDACIRHATALIAYLKKNDKMLIMPCRPFDEAALKQAPPPSRTCPGSATLPQRLWLLRSRPSSRTSTSAWTRMSSPMPSPQRR